MNGVRSIPMRKGYLLTALAAAVLLAASSGTAYAQSIGFVGTSATLGEGAQDPKVDPAAPSHPVIVKIRIAGLTDLTSAALGTVTLEHKADLGADGVVGGGDDLDGNNRRVWQIGGTALSPTKEGIDNGGELDAVTENGDITLALIDPAGDGDWKNGKFTMTLKAGGFGITPSPATFSVTVMDNDTPPSATFSKTSISLTEDSSTPVTVKVDVPRGTPGDDRPTALDGEITTTAPGRAAAPSVLMVMVNPADALDDDGERDGKTATDATKDDGPIEIIINSAIAEGADGRYLAPHMRAGRAVPGVYVVNEIDMLQDAASWTIRATKDMAGFRSPTVTVSFVAASLTTDVGDVRAGPALTIAVQSNEPVPTVTFATGSLSIDEGSTETVAILADGSTGPEVGSVMVGVSGDAMISLWQGMDMLEADAAGMYEVDLMGNANTILTVSADSDRELEDGMTSMATITLMSASGANIGDRDSVNVTVMGSTAVPALPLLGQLLLALFLLAGGARLYRRRQG